MKIISFVYCERIVQENQNLSIVNPLTMIVPINMPTNYSFSISIGLYDIPVNQNHTIKVELIDPNGEVVFEMPGDFKVENESLEEKTGAQFNIDINNQVFKEYGEYKTQVIINNEPLGEYPIEVVKRNERL